MARRASSAPSALHVVAPFVRRARRDGRSSTSTGRRCSRHSWRSSSRSGIAAHAFDELRGRPLGTELPSWLLTARRRWGSAAPWRSASSASRGSASDSSSSSSSGSFFVLAYDLELLGGVVHTDLGFAVAWGAFPVLTSAYAQASSISWSAVVLAGFAALSSAAQRNLSSPVRMIRRRVTSVEGEIRFADGSVRPDRPRLPARALRTGTAGTLLRDDGSRNCLRPRAPRSLRTLRSLPGIA